MTSIKNIQYQKRECLCGCGKTFKVWPATSPNWFASYFHAVDALKRGGAIRVKAQTFFKAYEAGRRRASPGRPKKNAEYHSIFGQFGTCC